MDRWLPALTWLRHYSRQDFAQDSLAAVIVTIMLIPQSLAYAMLAGLPPEAGLYASIVPILLYSLFGTSKTLAVGPVAVVSLMTAAAIGDVAQAGTADYATAALTLAAMSGGMLLLMGFLRLGVLASFLSHPVIAGFITASGLLIAASQLKHILAIDITGHGLPVMLAQVMTEVGSWHLATVVIGFCAIAFLVWVRKGLKPVLRQLGFAGNSADMFSRAGPILVVIVSTVAVTALGLEARSVPIVGEVPRGLPPFTTPMLDVQLLQALVMPALLISIIGFVESISVAQTLAAKRGERIDPNQELIGLGAANVGAAFTGGYPVTGGFARSVVNFDAGARTPAAGALTAAGLAIAALFLTPWFHNLPKAALGATIIVAVTTLIDFGIVKKSWRYSRADFAAVMTTIIVTLLFGVEVGVSAGVLLSLGLTLLRTTRPHIAEVGLVPDTEHFRNINRHDVLTCPEILTIRIDESLYFANAKFLEDHIYDRLADHPEIRHVILMCSAVNEIDLSALETLESINRSLAGRGTDLHLSEVKGPVSDRLLKTDFLNELKGQVFLSQFDAWDALTQGSARSEAAIQFPKAI